MEDLWNNPGNKSYAVFEGPNTREMPKLIAAGRNPISPEQLFYRKLEVLNECLGALKIKDKKAAEEWKLRMETYWNQLIDTGFGIAVHPDGNVKPVPNARYLRKLSPGTKLLYGIAVMPDGMYEKIDAQAYSAADIKKYRKKMPLKEALANPLLKEFIPNKNTRELAIINVFVQGKEHYGYDEMMGIYLPEACLPKAEKEPVMGLLSFGWLAFGSNIVCRNNLGGFFGGGRLVGVRDVAEGDASMHERSSAPQASPAELEHILKAA